MTAIAAARAATAPRDEETRLRAVARQLEGVFVEQLFKAMRETVPQDGMTHGGSGEDMFSGLLDQRLSASAPAQWSHGVGDALARQLAKRLHTTAPTSGDAPASSGPAAGATLPTRIP